MAPASRKRRSDAISRDASPSSASDATPPPARRRRQSSDDSDDSDARPPPATQLTSQHNLLVKKLVRLALSTEYARNVLRRAEITAKVFRDADGNTQTARGGGGGGASRTAFKDVFAGAQRVLRGTFGMELQELPSREKTSLKDRRAQASQAANSTRSSNNAATANSNKSWILVSVLPTKYKHDARIVVPSRVPAEATEAGYTAFYTLLVALVYLNNGEIQEQKLMRYLKRVNADTNTPWGSWEKTEKRLLKEGYLDRRKDTLSGEDQITYLVGARGKVEVGVRGVEGLVRSVYGLGAAGDAGLGPKMEEAELDKRLNRSLGTTTVASTVADAGGAAQSRDASPDQPPATQRRQARRRAAQDDD
jgi:melanoma-associated antigen